MAELGPVGGQSGQCLQETSSCEKGGGGADVGFLGAEYFFHLFVSIFSAIMHNQ